MENRKDQIEGAKAILRLSKYIIYLGLITAFCSLFLLLLAFSPYLDLFRSRESVSFGIPQSQESTSPLISATKPVVAGNKNAISKNKEALWTAPDSTKIPSGEKGKMIRYGKELVVHTARYWGPKGSIAHISNGMNCQNCHLEAGTKTFGNNFAVFFNNYPQISMRSGRMSPASQRITECIKRSLAGKSPDTNQREVKAILAYMAWVAKDVPKGKKIAGSGSEKLPFLDAAASVIKGKAIYQSRCQSCHGNNGQGNLSSDGREYIYPPVWGENSFNDGAGMYRISKMAGFIKNNMPYGATYQKPILTNEESWNVAAFIASQNRPHYNQDKDWKILKNKPIDFPFGPYPDPFTESQHKFGPFQPILAFQQRSLSNH